MSRQLVLAGCQFGCQLLFFTLQLLDRCTDHARLGCLQDADDLRRWYLFIAEMSVASVISDGIDSDDRHWRAGYAQALQDLILTLNRYRKV